MKSSCYICESTDCRRPHPRGESNRSNGSVISCANGGHIELHIVGVILTSLI
jgi:hypothetical protein